MSLGSQNHLCLRAGHGSFMCSYLLKTTKEPCLELEACCLFQLCRKENSHNVDNCGPKAMVPSPHPSSLQFLGLQVPDFLFCWIISCIFNDHHLSTDILAIFWAQD